MANKLVLAEWKKATLLTQKLNYLNTLQIRLYVSRVAGARPGDVTAGTFTWVNDPGAASPYPTMQLTTPVLNAAYAAQSNGTAITFTFQVPGGTPYAIQGFAGVDPTDSKVAFYQDLDAPLSVTTAGQQLTITPQFQDDTMP